VNSVCLTKPITEWLLCGMPRMWKARVQIPGRSNLTVVNGSLSASTSLY